MLYVLFEIWIWVVAAGLVGAVFGWWLRGMQARRQVAREAMLWQRRLEGRQTAEASDGAAVLAGNGRDGENAGT